MSIFLPCAPHYLPRVDRRPLPNVTFQSDLAPSTPITRRSSAHAIAQSLPRLHPFGRRSSSNVPSQPLFHFLPNLVQARSRSFTPPIELSIADNWSISEATLSDIPPSPLRPNGHRRRSGWDIQALAGVGFIALASPS
ncbi:hypothetical protein BJ684DRAFT_19948 [Piptocephalis cylindrospora]|uniref:Uncharacterized protein n=1 Tax=Piptocephalis cylindrospora TaxID=1907219 RepID=A0A4P9Y6T4_9FUNG|nr:hypothetical protein BJ684DRAFT_19948 [Piptocephalis cylindrospora]|eukprot:RKP13570.1 hypothetical protein BJ684DRAFT_19948 [Piptocephalis cylindrospora]